MTKSHIRAANVPIKIDVPKGPNLVANESYVRMKRGRPIGSKDMNSRKKKGVKNDDGQIEEQIILRRSPEETLDMNENNVSEETQVPENEEISIDYIMSGIKRNRNQIDVDDVFNLHAM